MTPGPWIPLSGPAHRIALDVLLDGPLSRAELSRRLDLSAGSLTRLTKPLLDAGLLVEVEDPAPGSRVGRPSQPLDVVPGAHHFVGVKLTGDTAHGVLTTLRADTVATDDLPLTDHSPGAVAETVARLVADLAARAPHDVTAVGVSLGGHVVGATDVVRAPFLDWADVPLGTMLRERTSLPTVIANDVTALTEATHWFGAGRGAATFALITLGAGVGFGLVAHGRLVTNDEASLGLVGHHPLDPAGPPCFLGHRGCATAMLAIGSITAQISIALGRPVGYDEALDLALAGDRAARRVVDDAGGALGRLVAAAANFTMPDRIVLGGEGVRLADVAHDALLAGLHSDRDPLARDPQLATLSPSFTEWASGAAVIAIQTFVLGT
ncbi:ROK family transcriptional regulator [Cellulosimicrobium cellulans]|uniref:ROK family transcriptional regulator n=1 Tax=Cellulosimicrobium cellulans TaxID=1710 RepID=UPI001E32DD86|nr:ROK family transcriptional regulator [Cellulosimicrobium cellulans]